MPKWRGIALPKGLGAQVLRNRCPSTPREGLRTTLCCSVPKPWTLLRTDPSGVTVPVRPFGSVRDHLVWIFGRCRSESPIERSLSEMAPLSIKNLEMRRSTRMQVIDTPVLPASSMQVQLPPLVLSASSHKTRSIHQTRLFVSRRIGIIICIWRWSAALDDPYIYLVARRKR